MSKEAFEIEFDKQVINFFLVKRQLPEMRKKMGDWRNRILGLGDLNNNNASFEDTLKEVSKSLTVDNGVLEQLGPQVWISLRTYHKSLIYFNHNVGNKYIAKALKVLASALAGDLGVVDDFQGTAPGEERAACDEWKEYKPRYDHHMKNTKTLINWINQSK